MRWVLEKQRHTIDTQVFPQTTKALCPATQAAQWKISQMASCDHVATSNNVNNHVRIMQKVHKQQTEGQKLA